MPWATTLGLPGGLRTKCTVLIRTCGLKGLVCRCVHDTWSGFGFQSALSQVQVSAILHRGKQGVRECPKFSRPEKATLRETHDISRLALSASRLRNMFDQIRSVQYYAQDYVYIQMTE